MAAGRQDQILRFLVQAEGADALKPFLESVRDLEGASEDTRKAADALLTELESAAGLSKTLADFEKLSAAVDRTKTSYDAAKIKVDALAKGLEATQQPSKRQIEQFDQAQASLTRLGNQYAVQQAKLGQLSSTLTAAGVSTNNFAAAQAKINATAAQASQGLQQLSASAKATKTEQEALAARLADGDEAFRRQAESSRLAREALEKVRAKTRETADAQQAAAAKSGVLGAAWSKLAAIGATLVGYLSINAAIQGAKNLLGLADASEKTRIQLAGLYGSVDAGNAAFEKLRKLAQDNGQVFGDTAASAAKLKGFGIDPLNGSLQALIDQNARLGGSQETLNGLILATGQAWAKQKLQGEEILQLAERGVPVWDLLAKATGKNTLELQKLSKQGKLGRDVIAALIKEIGASADGAAAKNLGTFSGLITQIKDRWEQFLQSIADAGVLDYAKQQLSSLIDEAKRLAADGTLTQWAKSTADALKAVGSTIASVTSFVYEHASSIGVVIKAYLQFKAVQLSIDLLGVANKWRTIAAETIASGAAASGATTKFGGLIATLRRLPAAVQVAVAVVGFEILTRTAELLAEIAAKNSEIAKNVEASAAARRAAAQSEVDSLHLAQRATIEYADVQVKSALEVARLNTEELAAYQQKLAGAKEYALQQYGIALRQQEIYGSTVQTNEAVAEANARIQELRAGFDDVAKGSEIAAEALKSGIGAAAQEIALQIGDITSSATAAETKLAALFADIDTVSPTRLGDIALALTSIGGEGGKAAENLRRGLSATLAKLSGEDLLKLQSAAQAAFDEFGVSASRAADVTNAVLLAALQKLGIEGDLLGVKFTDAGRDIIASFEVVAESANATSAQIEAAFRAALRSVGTTGEAEALAKALESAGARGRVSLDALSRSAVALKDRLQAIQAATDPLTDSFRQLGITSQRELDRAAAAAKGAFEQIVAGAKSGQASTEDVARAFQAYAQRARDAAETADAATKRQVASQIELAGRIAGVKDELIAAATAGLTAGDAIEDGGNRASESWSKVTESVRGTNDELRQTGDAVAEAADRIAEGAQQAADRVNETIISTTELTDQWRDIARLFGVDVLAWDRLAANAELANQRFTNSLLIRRRAVEEETAAVDTLIQKEKELADVRAGGLNYGGGPAASGDGGTTATGSRSSTVELVIRNEQTATGGSTRLPLDQLDLIAQQVLDALRRDRTAAGF